MGCFGSAKDKIIEIVALLMERTGKSYCFPSQETLLTMLREYYGIKISRRMLNYHLRDLEDRNLIRRQRRIIRLPNGSLDFKSSLYFFQAAGYRLLNRIKKYAETITRLFISNSANRKHRKYTFVKPSPASLPGGLFNDRTVPPFQLV